MVGAGAAGLAAAWSAVRCGARVRLCDAGVGASGLGGGAVDDRPWECLMRAGELLGVTPLCRALPEAVRSFAAALGLWHLPEAGCPLVRLATDAGRVRPARGRDRALLDPGELPAGAAIVLPRVLRPEWDADGLARALGDDEFLRSRGVRCVPAQAELLLRTAEERIAAADLAARHDEPARLDWLGQRLEEVVARARVRGGRADALLLGPWLGARAPRAEILRERVGLPVGEILAGVGGAAGLRFEAAREGLLGALGIELERARVLAVEPAPGALRLELADADPFVADAVVLAVGGLAAGGIRYTPPEQVAAAHEEPVARAPFALSLRAPVELRALGRRLEVVSSLSGPALDEIAWPRGPDPGLLEAVGVACTGSCCAPGIYAAGDVVADRPRTLLRAVASGIEAGEAAAQWPSP
ncbi:MAG: hypothetical protein HY744_07160 [Deltaproteobacteria bacterium]|nr:hypothetical protein [Deltaproteobacteria bacterium]